jgi:hypothetical protein
VVSSSSLSQAGTNARPAERARMLSKFLFI